MYLQFVLEKIFLVRKLAIETKKLLLFGGEGLYQGAKVSHRSRGSRVHTDVNVDLVLLMWIHIRGRCV